MFQCLSGATSLVAEQARWQYSQPMQVCRLISMPQWCLPWGWPLAGSPATWRCLSSPKGESGPVVTAWATTAEPAAVAATLTKSRRVRSSSTRVFFFVILAAFDVNDLHPAADHPGRRGPGGQSDDPALGQAHIEPGAAAGFQLGDGLLLLQCVLPQFVDVQLLESGDLAAQLQNGVPGVDRILVAADAGLRPDAEGVPGGDQSFDRRAGAR